MYRRRYTSITDQISLVGRSSPTVGPARTADAAGGGRGRPQKAISTTLADCARSSGVIRCSLPSRGRPICTCVSKVQRMPSVRPPFKERRVRSALIGCGRIASNRVDAIRRHKDLAEFLYVSNTEPRALEAVVRKAGAQSHASLASMLASNTADCVVATAGQLAFVYLCTSIR